MLWLYPFLIAFYLSESHREMQAEAHSLLAPVFDKSMLPLLLLTFAIVTASSSGLWIQLHLSKCHLQPATPHTHVLPRELSPLFYMQTEFQLRASYPRLSVPESALLRYQLTVMQPVEHTVYPMSYQERRISVCKNPKLKHRKYVLYLVHTELSN